MSSYPDASSVSTAVPVFSFPKLSLDGATRLLGATGRAMSTPGDGKSSMGPAFDDIEVQGRQVSGLLRSRNLCWDLGQSLMAYMAEELPSVVAQESARTFTARALRATSSFNIASGVVLPGDTSGAITLQLGGSSRFVLVEMCCSRYVADRFVMTRFDIGASKLVTQSSLSPASIYQGLTMSVYDASGESYNDVMPEFGVEWAGAVGAPLTVTAEFRHVLPSDDPAIAILSLLCLVDTCSGRDAYRRAATQATTLGGLPQMVVPVTGF